MFNRVFLVVYVLLFSVLLSTAAPVPVDGALTKKGLKQLKLKRGDPAPVKREGVELINKRQDAAAPKPSKRAFKA